MTTRIGATALRIADVVAIARDGARVALDDDHAEPTSVGLNGVREADDARTDHDEVGGRSGCVVGHDADCTVIATRNAVLV